MLKEKRLKILDVINSMEKTICKPCGIIDTATCNKCPIGFEFQKLGDRLMQISDNKNKKLLKKGSDMTISDVKRLLNKGITRGRISKAIGCDVSKIIGTSEEMDHTKYLKLAKENVIPESTYYHRVHNTGMTQKEAATTPHKSKSKGRKYPSWVYKKMEENNITINQFYSRVHKGWDVKRACTQPVRGR